MVVSENQRLSYSSTIDIANWVVRFNSQKAWVLCVVLCYVESHNSTLSATKVIDLTVRYTFSTKMKIVSSCRSSDSRPTNLFERGACTWLRENDVNSGQTFIYGVIFLFCLQHVCDQEINANSYVHMIFCRIVEQDIQASALPVHHGNVPSVILVLRIRRSIAERFDLFEGRGHVVGRK